MTRAPEQAQIARDAARVFSSVEGERVLGHLRALTRGRVVGPEASDALLRHVEGQRALVVHLEALIVRGRAPIVHDTRSNSEGDSNHDR